MRCAAVDFAPAAADEAAAAAAAAAAARAADAADAASPTPAAAPAPPSHRISEAEFLSVSNVVRFRSHARRPGAGVDPCREKGTERERG